MRVCAVVDAYSSGNLLAPAFASRGYESIHVRSQDFDLPLMTRSFHRDDFRLDLAAFDIEALATTLKEHGVEFVLAGCEVGVELADLLNEKLGLPGNGTALSSARRDKFEMIETIRDAGLRTARQMKGSSLAAILDFAATFTGGEVVLKALRSSGTNLVFHARGESEIRRAFERILSQKTMFGEVNTEVCVQEFLRGDEFIVDTVSSDGEHVVTDIWRYNFSPETGIPSYTELLDLRDPQLDSIKSYALQLLNALGIRWGPAHPEIMLTDNGPVVIEVGARLAGVKIPLYVKAATGRSQVDLTVDAFCDPQAFEVARRSPDALKTRCLLVSLISRSAGKLKSLSRLEEVERLPSFFQANFWVSPGDVVQRTVDDVTSPGMIVLMHTDPEVLRRDREAIRRLESEGLYEFET